MERGVGRKNWKEIKFYHEKYGEESFRRYGGFYSELRDWGNNFV
jgi:hypothetical protein